MYPLTNDVMLTMTAALHTVSNNTSLVLVLAAAAALLLLRPIIVIVGENVLMWTTVHGTSTVLYTVAHLPHTVFRWCVSLRAISSMSEYCTDCEEAFQNYVKDRDTPTTSSPRQERGIPLAHESNVHPLASLESRTAVFCAVDLFQIALLCLDASVLAS